MKLEKLDESAMTADDNREVRRVVGVNLKLLRESKDMTREEFAEKFGVSPYSIRNFESGEKSPKIPTLVKYADFYDVSLDEIFGRDSYVDKIIFNYRLETAKEHIGRYIELEDSGKNIYMRRDKVTTILPFLTEKDESKDADPPVNSVVISHGSFVMFYDHLILKTSVLAKTFEEVLYDWLKPFFSK